VTLSDGVDSVALPAHLQWPDEVWQAVAQTVDWTGDGQCVVDAWQRLTGRPITLEGAADRGWLDASADGGDADRSRKEQLEAWYAEAGRQLTLSGLRDLADKTVIWRHEEPPALVLEPIDPDSDHRRARYWRIVLRLRVVS